MLATERAKLSAFPLLDCYMKYGQPLRSLRY
jgi:hypothetical protein